MRSRRARPACSIPVTTACSRRSSSAATSGARSTGGDDPGRLGRRAGAAWFDVRPQPLRRRHRLRSHTASRGTSSLAGNYLLYPAIQAAPSGKAVMVMTLSGERQIPERRLLGARQRARRRSARSTIAADGTTNYDPAATRWGDYSWAVLDPSGNSVWMATEYMPPKASQTTDGLRNWGTRVLTYRQADDTFTVGRPRRSAPTGSRCRSGSSPP